MTTRSSADFSDDGLYRYELRRSWPGAGTGNCLWIMLNPSTADAEFDDPTIRRCIGFSKSWGFGGLIVANLYAFRATKPADMKKAWDPVGPENDDYLLRLFHNVTVAKTIAAWGGGASWARVYEVDRLARKAGRSMEVLGLTKTGMPVHPLYQPAERRPSPWMAPSVLEG